MNETNISRRGLEQAAARAAEVARGCGFGLSLHGRDAATVTGVSDSFPLPHLLPLTDWRDPKDLQMLPGFGIAVAAAP